MSILKTLTINGTTYTVTPVVPKSSVTLLADRWVSDGNGYSQVVEIPGVIPRSKVNLQPTKEQHDEFHKKILAFVAKNENGTVTVHSIGDKPNGDHTIQITLQEVEGTGTIWGNTVGTTMPVANLQQDDPTQADYVAGKEEFSDEVVAEVDEKLRPVKTVNGASPDENGNVSVDTTVINFASNEEVEMLLNDIYTGTTTDREDGSEGNTFTEDDFASDEEVSDMLDGVFGT